MKKVAILGVSGSIGTSTIEVIRKHPNEFDLVAISVYSNDSCLYSLLDEFKNIEVVGVKSIDNIKHLIDLYPTVRFVEGQEGLVAVSTSNCDIVLNALVGFVGLYPTIKAIECNKDIALANKECLVVAGELITKLVKKHNVRLYPVDSEHSAIFQCLESNKIHKIILTASGGPFYKLSLDDLKNVTLEDALNHPNWSMGKKITIDSATMMNKAFEIIEARWLFDLNSDQIEVVIHPQSIVHSMVEYEDGSIKAQLGVADMKLPIAYALSYPTRLSDVSKSLSFVNALNLEFIPMDVKRFEAISFAYKAIKDGGLYPTVLNAANEVAVQMFLQKQISFDKIIGLIKETLNNFSNTYNVTLESIFKVDKWAREYTRRLVINGFCV